MLVTLLLGTCSCMFLTEADVAMDVLVCGKWTIQELSCIHRSIFCLQDPKFVMQHGSRHIGIHSKTAGESNRDSFISLFTALHDVMTSRQTFSSVPLAHGLYAVTKLWLNFYIWLISEIRDLVKFWSLISLKASKRAHQCWEFVWSGFNGYGFGAIATHISSNGLLLWGNFARDCWQLSPCTITQCRPIHLADYRAKRMPVEEVWLPLYGTLDNEGSFSQM